MHNVHSSSGIAEDMIRSFTHMACAEMHLKTLYEKAVSDLDNHFYDEQNADAHKELTDKIEEYEYELMEIAQVRREMMLATYELYGGGDKDVWCMIKHLSVANMCVWESWQISDNNRELLKLALKSNDILIKYMARFLGIEVTNCASCFADLLKAYERSQNDD